MTQDNRFFVAVSRNSRDTVSIDDVVKAIEGVADAYILKNSERIVRIYYSGSLEELRKTIGYSKEQVHIEVEILHNPLSAPQKILPKRLYDDLDAQPF